MTMTANKAKVRKQLKTGDASRRGMQVLNELLRQQHSPEGSLEYYHNTKHYNSFQKAMNKPTTIKEGGRVQKIYHTLTKERARVRYDMESGDTSDFAMKDLNRNLRDLHTYTGSSIKLRGADRAGDVYHKLMDKPTTITDGKKTRKIRYEGHHGYKY